MIRRAKRCGLRAVARRGRKAALADTTPKRDVNYRQLRNPFPQMSVFSEDQIAAIHDTSLRTLEELGMRVLLPDARKIFRQGGARVVDDMVYIGREMVAGGSDNCSQID